MRYRLSLMGPFRFVAANGAVVEIASHRMQVLVAALVRARGRPVPRQRLRDLLWEDRSEEQGRNSLRKLLSDLRRAFDPAAGLPFLITATDVAADLSMIATDLDELAELAEAGLDLDLEPRPYAELLEGVDLPGADFR